MPSSPVLLNIYVSLIFGTVIPTFFNILMNYCFTKFSVVYSLANTMLRVLQAPPLLLLMVMWYVQ